MISNDIFKRENECAIVLSSIPKELFDLQQNTLEPLFLDALRSLTKVYLDGKWDANEQWIKFQNTDIERRFIAWLLQVSHAYEIKEKHDVLMEDIVILVNSNDETMNNIAQIPKIADAVISLCYLQKNAWK